MALKDFIPVDKQHLITEAIVRAEQMTTGEVVVHITPYCKKDVIASAEKIFNKKKLYNTVHRNAVLIYIAHKDHKLAIIGDAGIYDVAPKNLWDEDVELLRNYIAHGDVVEGIVATVERIGERLSQYFPDEDGDLNEISNEISYED